MNHSIETNKLRLNQLTEDNRKGFSSLLQNDDVIRYCFDPLSAKDIEDSFQSRLADWSINSEHWLCLAVNEKTTGNFVGTNGFRVNVKGSTLEVGFLFLPEYQGKGYATESLKGVLEYARILGFDAAIAHVTEGNSASCRVLEKCGFVVSRIDSCSVSINNLLHNNIVYEVSLD